MRGRRRSTTKRYMSPYGGVSFTQTTPSIDGVSEGRPSIDGGGRPHGSKLKLMCCVVAIVTRGNHP